MNGYKFVLLAWLALTSVLIVNRVGTDRGVVPPKTATIAVVISFLNAVLVVLA